MHFNSVSYYPIRSIENQDNLCYTIVMRKNLTISLLPEDWKTVQQTAKSLGETYSQFFHRIIREFFSTNEVNHKTVAKYRPLFKSHASFLTGRSLAFARPRPRRKNTV